MPEFTLLDIAAVSWALLCWVGYTIFADASSRRRNSISANMARNRHRWMEQMLQRNLRMVDTSIAGNLITGISFFSSTTILVLIGLIALLGYTEKAIQTVSRPALCRRNNGSSLGMQGRAADSDLYLCVLQVHMGIPSVELLFDPDRCRPGPKRTGCGPGSRPGITHEHDVSAQFQSRHSRLFLRAVSTCVVLSSGRVHHRRRMGYAGFIQSGISVPRT